MIPNRAPFPMIPVSVIEMPVMVWISRIRKRSSPEPYPNSGNLPGIMKAGEEQRNPPPLQEPGEDRSRMFCYYGLSHS